MAGRSSPASHMHTRHACIQSFISCQGMKIDPHSLNSKDNILSTPEKKVNFVPSLIHAAVGLICLKLTVTI